MILLPNIVSVEIIGRRIYLNVRCETNEVGGETIKRLEIISAQSNLEERIKNEVT